MISRTKLASFSFGENLRAGDHICQFFRSADELSEVLVPYFKAGLERNECCLWITSGPYGGDRATSEMRTAVPDFDRKAAAGQIQILGHEEWYTRQGTLNAAEIIEGWLSRKDHALASGHAGLRISGNTSFLSENAWDDFQAYERSINLAFRGQPIIALCSYSMSACSAANVLDVMGSHAYCLAKSHDEWGLIGIKRHSPEASQLHANPPPRAYYRLRGSYRRGTEVRRMLADCLASYRKAWPERIALEGDNAHLSARQSTKLRPLIRELVANSARHGALSWRQGKLTVAWRVSVNGSRRLHLKWLESGMVNLPIPDKIGSGTLLLVAATESFERVFAPTGMTCAFELDLDSDEWKTS